MITVETANAPVVREPAHQHLRTVWRSGLRAVFTALLAVYGGWNLYWLAQLQLAPSLFQTLTGLPCPTTGCTRSFLALCRAEWQESLRFNALLVPICLLAIVSVLLLGGQAVQRRKLSLPSVLVVLWGIVLPLAWILKLAGDPRYW